VPQRRFRGGQLGVAAVISALVDEPSGLGQVVHCPGLLVVPHQPAQPRPREKTARKVILLAGVAQPVDGGGEFPACGLEGLGQLRPCARLAEKPPPPP